jgi:hypothetical protein
LIGCAEPPGQERVHCESALQESEHEPLQVTWQVAPLVHEMLPLLPTVSVQAEPTQSKLALSAAVRVQVLPIRQPPLHEAPQAPMQVAFVPQVKEQLPCMALQPVEVQVPFAAQVHIVEVAQMHCGPGHGVPCGAEEPHPAARAMSRIVVRMGSPGLGCLHCARATAIGRKGAGALAIRRRGARAHGEDGAGRVAQHALGDRAEQRVLKPGAPVRADDDEIEFLVAGEADDLAPRVAADGARLHARAALLGGAPPGGEPVVDVGEQIVERGRRRQEDALGQRARRHDVDVKDGERGVEARGQLGGLVERLARGLRKIDGAEDPAVGHARRERSRRRATRRADRSAALARDRAQRLPRFAV